MRQRCYLLSGINSKKGCIALTDSHYYSEQGSLLAKRMRGITELNCRFRLVTTLITRQGLKYLEDVNLEETPLEDNLGSNLLGLLISERMKAIIDAHLSGKEDLKWVKAYVDGPHGMSWIYYVPLFWKRLDVLNHEKTVISDSGWMDHIVFDPNKVKDLAIFKDPTITRCLTTSVYVTHKLKMALRKEGMKGLSFSEMSVE